MKKTRMNISYFRIILFNLKIFCEIVTIIKKLKKKALFHRQFYCGSDYFTENFQLKGNKTRMRNIHSRFFHLLF